MMPEMDNRANQSPDRQLKSIPKSCMMDYAPTGQE